jgi:16S rRNA A1518/A1519 N6-dimethyltransferase RsmA/KsgA/DIM1 with predicted DNA glycosylase/AP lyase activity
MSRTKGVDSEIRHVHDEYITPPWCVRRLLEKYTLRPGQIILDPCASRGELLLEVKMNRPDLVLAGIEINSTCAISLAQVVGPNVICPQDFLKIPFPSVPGRSLTVLTNPPYCLAQEFVEHSLRFAEIAIMLLRLNFLGGRDRREFTARTNPGIFALPNRPCFNGYGSDACEYG